LPFIFAHGRICYDCRNAPAEKVTGMSNILELFKVLADENMNRRFYSRAVGGLPVFVGAPASGSGASRCSSNANRRLVIDPGMR
jgi:hypothetical protein